MKLFIFHERCILRKGKWIKQNCGEMVKILSQNFYFPHKHEKVKSECITTHVHFWRMFDFYPTCLEKTKDVSIFTPGCFFPHMFGFWHTCMGKGTHVWKKPHNYMFENVWLFPHMCGKSHWHAYFPLSYRWAISAINSSSSISNYWVRIFNCF